MTIPLLVDCAIIPAHFLSLIMHLISLINSSSLLLKKDSIDSVAATDSNSDYNAASDIDPISSSEKSGVTTSILSITA
jgi:hypothetical protein